MILFHGQESNRVLPMGIISSFNRIGTRWAGGDYRLITEILRNEWGFRGSVITDFNTCNHMVEKDMFYAGGNQNLQFAGQMVWKPDAESVADVSVLRESAKGVLYTVANSNAMRGEFQSVTPTWMIVMYVIDAIIVATLILWGFFAIRKAGKPKKRL